MIKGVHFVRKILANGCHRWYVYAWRGGPLILSTDGPRKPKLTQDAIAAIATAMKRKSAERLPDPTVFLSLIRTWRSDDPNRPSSPEWEKLAATTKKIWGSSLNKIEEKWGEVPLAVFNDPRMIAKVIAWRNSREATPRAADNGVVVLHALLKFGMQQSVLSMNVAAGIGKIYLDGARAEIVWTENDLKAFKEAAENQDRHVNDAVELDAVTGLRREDLTNLTWAEVRQFAIVKKAAKRSRGRRRFATIPRIPALDTVLDRLRTRPRGVGVETVLVTAKGMPWNPDTLSKDVARVAKKAGIVHIDQDTGTERRKHLHDVRGTFVTRLATSTDLTDTEIASIMAWSEDEVAGIRRIYVDDTVRNVALGRRIARGL